MSRILGVDHLPARVSICDSALDIKCISDFINRNFKLMFKSWERCV